ncbi:MAG: DUF1194 domain-containing protein [Hyphomicrobiaceae bacterium]|nr:MAG: DUF1194 domain-containing protein [Hyphomicrobiaceae bacterium]
MSRRLCAISVLLSVLAVPLHPQTSRADVLPVDVELVLAVDVSLSMDLEEQALQREGYAAAFRDPQIIAAIKSNVHGRIAVTYVEWAGVGNLKLTIPWMLIDSVAAGEAFEARLRAEPISRWRKTSISSGLLFAAKQFEGSNYKGERRVIDISGDGPNNDGPPVESVRDRLVSEGIVINGLPLLLKAPQGWFDLLNLDEYYEDCVIGGTGSFSIPVRRREEFVASVKRKILLEVSSLAPRLVPVQAPGIEKPQVRKRVDCLIGERLWQRYFGRGTF